MEQYGKHHRPNRYAGVDLSLDQPLAAARAEGRHLDAAHLAVARGSAPMSEAERAALYATECPIPYSGEPARQWCRERLSQGR